MSQAGSHEQLKLRARLVPSHQIPITTLDLTQFKEAITNTIQMAPDLFQRAPVILDLTEIEDSDDLTFEVLESAFGICRELSLIPYAITGTKTKLSSLIENAPIAWVEKRAEKASKEKQPTYLDTKIISTPVRSGQQIYAKDAHLLIMNQVSAGAEVIADGNIHIFGALRGRAIAGAKGFSKAEIVCQQMLAELVAIAGNYLVQDDFPEGEGAARCRLDDETMQIDYL